MEEKILIEGKRNSTLALILLLPSAFFVLLGLIFVFRLIVEGSPWPYVWYTDPKHHIAIGSFVVALVLKIIFSKFSKSKITVTNKRVYGCAAFGKRVDIPIDSISAVSVEGVFSGIAVASSSGVIRFYLMANHRDIHKIISDLLINRQSNPSSVVQQVVNQTSAKELKEYKDLLDSGIISQEEFDAKKKQLLGL